MRRAHIYLLILTEIWRLADASDVTIETAVREINLQTQVATVTHRLFFKNSGKEGVDALDICYPERFKGHEAVVEVIQDKDSPGGLKLLPSKAGDGRGATCVTAQLINPLAAGQEFSLDVGLSLSQLQTPFPEAIFQNEAQRVLYLDNVFILSPYKILKQVTKVTLPSKNIESFTKTQPVKQKKNVLEYGEYVDVGPFRQAKLELHYENNSPFAVATSLIREFEVSHWGNVYVEEQYDLKHAGAKLRGEFSRLELMRDPQHFGQAAIRGFMATLPSRAHSIYFKDAIGNISTSQVRRNAQSTDVVLTPRYPLFGGWRAQFTLGYSLPLEDVVSKDPKSGALRLRALFGVPIVGLIAEAVENQVVLPEGSRVLGVEAPFEVLLRRGTKFSYLDTSGRPLTAIRKINVAFEHNQPFTITYTFSPLSLLREPFLLVAFYALLFVLVIAYYHCNFAITHDAKWEQDKKAERTAFLVQEVSSLIKKRETQVAAATSSPNIDSLLEKLKQSEAKLKQLCSELEQLSGTKQLRDLLDKEKALQVKIAQIAATKGQLLQQGSSQQAAQEKVAQEMQTVSKNLQRQRAAKLQSLS